MVIECEMPLFFNAKNGSCTPAQNDLLLNCLLVLPFAVKSMKVSSGVIEELFGNII